MRIPMQYVYEKVAACFIESRNLTPSHCDVRCACNDALDSLERDGHKVHHGYDQDRAFHRVRGIILNLTD
jgi:hypothetical protein